MGDFCEKSDFSPLKVENTQKIFQKIAWLSQDQWGGGVTKMEKYFFAFLDKLDHLEAIINSKEFQLLFMETLIYY